MNVKSQRSGTVAKKVTAWSLAALTALTCVGTLPSVINNEASAASGILSNADRGVLYASTRSDFRDETIYFLITTRFYDGDPSNNYRSVSDAEARNPEDDPSWRGDFKGLIDKLDYIKALGFTAIWITPVVQNNSNYDYHGYHASNFNAVDYRYESNGVTYQDLIDACHAKGMKIIQDVVFNHTCRNGEEGLNKLGGEVMTNQLSLPWPQMNEVIMSNGAQYDPNNIYHHNTFAGSGDYDNYNAQIMTIADDCFDLETENPVVANYLVEAYKKYIDMGVDAFRVDTARHISRFTMNAGILPHLQAEAEKIGNDDFYMFGEVCTRGHDVWYRGVPAISTCFYTWDDTDADKAKWSNTDLATNEALAEACYNNNTSADNQPTSDNAFLNGNEYHQPDYSKRSDLGVIDFQMHWSFENANSAFSTALGEDRYFNDSTWNVVYVNSHDYSPDFCSDKVYTGDTESWAENLSLMFTFRGIPCIYYGTEIEFQKGCPIDKGPKAMLSETGRAYFGDHMEGEINTGDFTVYNATGAAKTTLESPLSQHLIRLNRIRQAVPALRKGQYSTEGCSGSLAFKRRYTDSTTDSFACVAISGDATFTGIPDGTYVDAVTGDTKTVSGGTLSVSCSGKGNLRVYVLNTSKTPAPGRVVPNGTFMTDGGGATTIGDEDVTPVNIIKETGVTVSPTTVTVKQLETASVTATVTPSNATYKTITWSSADESIATVSGGTIKGVGIGSTTVTATTKHGLTAKVTVKVTKNDSIVDPTGVSVSPSTLTLTAGDSSTLTATVTPSNATDKTVTWSSSNTSVATVDANGKVTAVAAGSATITATTSNGKKGTAAITVEGKSFTYVDHGIYFEKPSSWGSNINAYIYDGATDSPSGVGPEWPGAAMKDCGNGVYSLEKTTDKTTLLVIFNDGSNQVPGSREKGFEYKDCGYYTSNGFKEIITKPTNVEVTSVTMSPTSASVKVGATTTLSATVAPSNATDKTITWKSSDTSVATVSNGVVTGVAAGSATITASSSNGKTATATVTVTKDTSTLSNTSKISATSVQAGNSVTVTCSASGGSGTKTYGVYYKKSSASSWTTVNAMGSAAKATITFKNEGTYTVRANVKDGDGTLVRKDFTVTVTAVPSFTNSSKLSATTVTAGDTIKATFSSSGGSGTLQYGIYYRKSGASSWTTARSYATGTSATFTIKTAGTYEVSIVAKDGSGTTAKKNFTVKVEAAVTTLKNTSTISASKVTVGTAVTVTGASSGGSGTKNFGLWYKLSSASTWTQARAYSTTKSMSFTPKTAGTYTVRVIVKDGNGTKVNKDFTLTVVKALANTSKLTATTITKSNTAKVTCASTGGIGTKKYAVWYKRASVSTWAQAQDYSTNTSVSFKPNYTGAYDISVKVKDGNGTTVKKTLTLTVNAALANTSKLSATTIAKGDTVKVTCASTGGIGTKKYAVWYKRASVSTWAQAQDYSTNASVSFKPNYTGAYDVSVKVKDGNGTIVKKALTLTVNAALANTSKLSAAAVTKGNTVKVTCASTGGVGTKKYAVWYKRASVSTWAQAQDYSTNTSVSFKPNYTGKYDVSVKVKDGNGTTVKKALTLTVNEALANTTKISASSITKGSTIKLTCASTGGTGTKKYAVWYKRSSVSTWTQAQDYSTTTSVSIKPNYAQQYDVSVKVKDGAGNIAKKTFTFSVTDPDALVNSSKISASSVTAGGTVKVTCAASNGTSPYYYQVERMKAGESTWTVIQKYATTTSVSVKIPATGTYQVKVTATDMEGKTAVKYFTVTGN